MIEQQPSIHSFKQHRLRIPLLGMILFFISITVAIFLPEDFAPFVRTAVVFIGGMISLLIILVWWLFLSRIGWLMRLAILAAVFGLWFATVYEVDYSGDVVPKIVWRWEKRREQKVAEHRNQQSVKELPEVDISIGPDDFPNYRNRNLDAVATGPKLWTNWKERLPRKVWAQPSGAGYSGFATAGNLIFTLEQRGPDEFAVAYDKASGSERWKYSWKARHFDPLGGEGPMTTPTIHEGLLYCLGGTGHFACLDATSGKPIWEKELLEDNANLQWGMSGSPLIYKNLVIVHPGEQAGKNLNREIRAFDRKTGKIAWQTGNNRTGYCSPMLANLLGRQMLLLFSAVEILGINPDTGEKLWAHPWTTNQGIHVAQPIPISDDKVFISSSYGVGCGLLQLSTTGGTIQSKELWHNLQLRSRFNSPVLHNSFIYGLDEGILVCLDPVTGRRKWKGERYGQGQILRQDDLIVIQAENGDLAIVKANPEAFEQLGRFKALGGDKTWNCPTLANGFAFLRNHNEMACYDLRQPQP